jgi:ComF family protein
MPAHDGFCCACRGDFLRVVDACDRCGLPRPCAPCPARERSWRLAAVRAPFAYVPPLSRFLHELKYRRRRSLGAALGKLLADDLLGIPCRADAIVAVPMHPRRLRARTFNQADEIARPVARLLGLPMLVRGLRRHQHTQSQTTLDRRARIRALAEAFAVERELDGMRIAVIDDVVTTGATVNALAAALAAAGARSTEAWALARTTPARSDPAQTARNT